MKSSSSFGNVDVEAVPKLGETGRETDFIDEGTFDSDFNPSPDCSTLVVASILPLTLWSPLSEPPEGVFVMELVAFAGVLTPEAAWFEGETEVAADVTRPLAACAYEKAGGAGAASPADFDVVELMMKWSKDNSENA